MTASDFWSTYLNPFKIIESKRKYKQQMARVKALPDDYQFVFEKIQHYMWMHAGGDGADMLKLQYDLIDLFEDGAANGKHILEVTGEDVAGFCDEILRNAKTWMQSWPEKLNRDILKKVGRGKTQNDEHRN